MNDREKLIEEAADQLLWTTRGDDEPGVDWPGDHADARRMAEVVLAVFEKAQDSRPPRPHPEDLTCTLIDPQSDPVVITGIGGEEVQDKRFKPRPS